MVSGARLKVKVPTERFWYLAAAAGSTKCPY